jgi:hypothetical protein
VDYSEKARELLGLRNASFRHCNFTQLDFRTYDHFYFFNSFYENLTGADKIDHSIHYSAELYQYYNRYLCQQLEGMPSGTKLATYQSMEEEVPKCYKAIGVDSGGLLKFWSRI